MKRALLLVLAIGCLSGAAFAQIIVVGNPPTVAQLAPPVISVKNNPQFSMLDSYWLQLPLVDSDAIPGLYQGVMIEYAPQTRTWQLKQYTRAEPVAEIEQVEVIVTDEVPAQVFLDITGTFADYCQSLGQVGVKQVSDAFIVYLFYQPGSNNADYICSATPDLRAFRKIVPLDVYGLSAHTYTWNVNGEFTGTFTLNAANVLQ